MHPKAGVAFTIIGGTSLDRAISDPHYLGSLAIFDGTREEYENPW
jgi:hypothetical protein